MAWRGNACGARLVWGAGTVGLPADAAARRGLRLGGPGRGAGQEGACWARQLASRVGLESRPRQWALSALRCGSAREVAAGCLLPVRDAPRRIRWGSPPSASHWRAGAWMVVARVGDQAILAVWIGS